MLSTIKASLAANKDFLKKYTYAEYKRLLLISLCYLIILVSAVRLIVYYLLGNALEIVHFSIAITPIVVTAMALLLMRIKYYEIGKTIIFTLIPVVTLAIANVYHDTTLSILFLLYAVIALVYYDNKWGILLFFGLNIVCYGLSQFNFYTQDQHLFGTQDVIYLLINTIIFFSVTFFILFYLKNLVNYYIQRMTNDNDTLVEINTDLMQIHNDLKEKNEDLELEHFNVNTNNKQLLKMFSVIAHDLKSPLISVKNILHYTQASKDSKTNINEYVPEISKTISNTVALLDNLLLWSRNQNATEIKQEVIHVQAAVDEVLELYSLPITSKKIQVQVENPVNAFINFNKPMLNTVLRNLISNAIKFTPVSGNLKVVIVPVATFYKVQVCNEVAHIDDATVSQLNNNGNVLQLGTQGETGSGFGLVITKDFLRSNNTELLFSQKNNKVVVAEFIVDAYANTKLKAINNAVEMSKYTLAVS